MQQPLALRKRLSIKLLLPIIFLTAALTLFSFYFLLLIQNKLIQENRHEHSLEIAESIQVTLDNTPNDATIIRFINSIGGYDNISSAYLIDLKNNTIIASSKNQYINTLLQESDISWLSQQTPGENRKMQARYYGENNEFIGIKLKKLDQSKRYYENVYLLLEINSINIQSIFLNSLLWQLFFVLLSTITALSGFYLWVKKLIIKPIDIFRNVLNDDGHHNFKLINYHSDDEIGELIKSYNKLLVVQLVYQNQLLAAKQQSEEAAKAKSDFIASVSHEVRTPLNGVTGMLQFLGQTNLDKKQLHFVNTIEKSVNHLISLINDILYFSKLEAEKLSLNPEPEILEQLIEETINIFSKTADQKNLNLNYYFKDHNDSKHKKNQKTVINIDKTRINQVLFNLLSNAIKFTTEGSIDVELCVLSKTEKSCLIQITVRDTGIGIKPEHQHKLFQPFMQSDSSTTRQYGGTGLGLSISKKIMSLMGGDISLQSKYGEGSCFTLSLETEVLQACMLEQRPAPQLTPQQPQVKSSYRVLAVEDTPVNLEILQLLMADMGVSLIPAHNGKEALTLCQEQHFDLILMDCLMPVMDGFDATRAIRELEKQYNTARPTPIIAITASGSKEVRDRCFDVGMNDFVLKPFKFDELNQKIVHWLSH